MYQNHFSSKPSQRWRGRQCCCIHNTGINQRLLSGRPIRAQNQREGTRKMMLQRAKRSSYRSFGPPMPLPLGCSVIHPFLFPNVHQKIYHFLSHFRPNVVLARMFHWNHHTVSEDTYGEGNGLAKQLVASE